MAEKIGRINGRVVGMTNENKKLLKKHFRYLEDLGCTKDKQEVCNEIFEIGLHAVLKEMK